MEQNISNIKRNILLYAEYKGFSKRRVYQDTGIANGVFDKTTGLSEDNIERFISTYDEVNPTWLLTGKGSMLKSKSEFAPPPIEPPPPGPAVESTQVIAYLERKITEKETELKEAYYEIGRLNALVEQLKKDTNKGNYAPGTSELERKK